MARTIGDTVARMTIVKDSPVIIKVGAGTPLEEVEGRHGTYFTTEVETPDGVRAITVSKRLLDRLIDAGIKTWDSYKWVKITRRGESFATDYIVEKVDKPK